MIRAAVIGVGYLGRFHAQKYTALENVNLVAVCDTQREQGEAVAQEVGTQWVSSYKELAGKVDAVTIATPTSSHFEIAKFFLENGVHVHVEKPMTKTVEEARALVELAAAQGLKLQVGHVERFNAAFLAAQKRLKAPKFLEAHRLAPFKPRGVDVDVVLDLMIHDLDVVLALVGPQKVQSVSAVGTPVLTKVVDIASARIEFSGGAVANLTASRVSQTAMRKLRVFQPDQYLSIDFAQGEIHLTEKIGEWSFGEQGEVDLESLPLSFDSWSMEKSDALLAETESFVHSIQTGEASAVSGSDGLRALELAEIIRKDIYERLQ